MQWATQTAGPPSHSGWGPASAPPAWSPQPSASGSWPGPPPQVGAGYVTSVPAAMAMPYWQHQPWEPSDNIAELHMNSRSAASACAAATQPEPNPGWMASAAVGVGNEPATIEEANQLHMLFSCVAERNATSRKRRTARLRVLIDSGSTHSFLAEKYSQFATPTGAEASVKMGNGLLQAAEVASLSLTFGGCKFQQQVGIMPLNAAFDVVLGQDWIDKHDGVLSYDRQDPDMIGLDRRHVSFRLNGKKHVVPVPPHLRESSLNSVVWNTAAALCKQSEQEVSASDASPAFLVYLQDAKATELAAMMQEQADVPAHDNSLPHHIDTLQTGFQCHTEGLQAPIAELIHEFKDRFPADVPAGLPPEREGVTHAIPLKSEELRPPYRRPYRLTPAERREVEDKLEDMLAKDWIQPSHSPYGAPILFVPKPDGGLRMCVDYRALNEQTVKNRYPLPRIDDLLDTLHGAKYFTALDLQQAYHQVRLKPEDVPKTAFLTHKGQYEYRVLSFGLTNAPATFQALMNRVLAPLLGKSCLVYLDDILIFSKTPEDHVQHLKEVLTIFRQQQLYCRLHKCKFAMQELPFLGHVVSHAGVGTNPAKVQVLLNWPAPTDVHELKCFLGLAQYFAKFIEGYASTSACLQALLKKKAVWHWSEACEFAFQEIKRKLTSAPVLALPDPTQPFEVVTDACQSGIGAVLLQLGRPVAFCGRLLTPAEQRYTTSVSYLPGVAGSGVCLNTVALLLARCTA